MVRAACRRAKSHTAMCKPIFMIAGASGGSSGGGALSGLAMPFVRGAHLRSHAARPYTFSNSPVNGLLYVRGTIGRPPNLRACCLLCNTSMSWCFNGVTLMPVDSKFAFRLCQTSCSP